MGAHLIGMHLKYRRAPHTQARISGMGVHLRWSDGKVYNSTVPSPRSIDLLLHPHWILLSSYFACRGMIKSHDVRVEVLSQINVSGAMPRLDP